MLHSIARSLFPQSDFEALDQDTGVYAEHIEEASDDRIKNWLIKLGLSEEEILAHEDAGLTLRDLAQDLYNQGYDFDPA